MPNNEMIDDVEKESVESILASVPEEERKTIKKFLYMSLQMARVSSPQSELMSKISPENISEVIELQGKEMDLDYKTGHEERQHRSLTVGLVVLLIIAIIFLLKEQPDLLKEILVPLVSVVVGGIGGYGYGYGKGKNDGQEL